MSSINDKMSSSPGGLNRLRKIFPVFDKMSVSSPADPPAEIADISAKTALCQVDENTVYHWIQKGASAECKASLAFFKAGRLALS